MSTPSSDITPGLLVLHGNRLELLQEAVFEWLVRHPLRPLEEETFLVQSNGVAEWLKMSLAARVGVCAATRVELPARFLWRCYRQVLGRAAVPLRSPVDRETLAWRLMALLPAHLGAPGFEPLAAFLAPGDPIRRLQLAQRLADLYDQYQVYRADWLQDWVAGRDVLRTPQGGVLPVPADQAWQPALWHHLLDNLGPAHERLTRDRIHRDAVAALEQGELNATLPRRLVVFGMAHLPMQTLEALTALARHTQVILAVPNPCRYHWADIMDGRELLHVARHRQPLRGGQALSALPLDQLHAHAHPLLAAWGRQGRDFIRQLDAFDDAQTARERFALPRIDLFDEGPGRTLLAQVQAHIRDMRPLAEHPPPGDAAPAAGDRSIVFHVAHSPQRELEILHDQLLALLADPPGGGTLTPRDIVVMVPDIEVFAPAIEAVFGQPARNDARRIPYEIADQRRREHEPLLVALDWLMQLPRQRCTVPELRDLMEVPAVMHRLGLAAQDLPRINQWLDGAQVRWGLDAAQRDSLGLGACGEQNTWVFGLQRMLLGYAAADGAAFAGIEPYGEVAGLEAALAGALAELVARLQHWRQKLGADHAPAAWGVLLRQVMQDFVQATDESDRLLLAELDEALTRWLEACELAGFGEPVPLEVVREAWLGALDDTVLGKRFMAGGVTFCTLMPMRAIPFEVVCLLGMNEGDYPRQAARNDIDLMMEPGLRRPGDRARRDDDRYLMLEALMSARQVLYVSWAGRSVRDNAEQPPSVLVAQLRDYLAAGWGGECVQRRTTEHPLQPFSRRYFEAAGAELFTYAREWQAAHGHGLPQGQPHTPRQPAAGGKAGAAVGGITRTSAIAADAAHSADAQDAADEPILTVRELASFLKNPVRCHLQRRLQVQLVDPREQEDALDEDEPFALHGLDEHRVLSELLDEAWPSLAWAVAPAEDDEGARMDPAALVDDAVERLQEAAWRLQRAGRLPLRVIGERTRVHLVAQIQPVLHGWAGWMAGCEPVEERRLLQFQAHGVRLEDWLDGLHRDRAQVAESAQPPGDTWWRLERHAARLTEGRPAALRGDRMLEAWVWALLSAAQGRPVHTMLLGRDAMVHAQPPTQAEAQAVLADLLAAWHEGMRSPLSVAARTALAWLEGGAKAAAQRYDGSEHQRGEGQDLSLARLYPAFDTLLPAGFEHWAERLYRPLHTWLGSAVEWSALGGDEGPPAAQDEAAVSGRLTDG